MALNDSADADSTSSTNPNARILAIGGTVTLLGIALAVFGFQELGSWLSAAALLMMLYALHRLGRQGPDEPIVFIDAARTEPGATKRNNATKRNGAAKRKQ